MQYKIILPWAVLTSFSKAFSINLNSYRNAHRMVLSKAKNVFAEMIQEQVEALPKMKGVRIKYLIFPDSKRRMDVSNVCSVADKFLCDCLVENGIIPDDDYKHVVEVIYRFGEVAQKGNARIEAYIEKIT